MKRVDSRHGPVKVIQSSPTPPAAMSPERQLMAFMDYTSDTGELRRIKRLWCELNAIRHDYDFMDSIQPAMDELGELVDVLQEPRN